MNATFPAAWLDLREPFDAAARAGELTADLAELVHRSRRRDRVLQIVDLGAGTGAQLRYAAPKLGGNQHWLLVERDPALLEALRPRLQRWAVAIGAQQQTGPGTGLIIQAARFSCRIDTLALDLAADLERLELPDEALLSGAALLDLVSERWLQALALRAARAAATVWFTLTFDGRMQCAPPEPQDDEVVGLFNAHQRTDKGFGPALGPEAARRAEQLLAMHGYRTRCAPSDWRLDPGQCAFQHALLEGWFDAACAIAPARAPALQQWRTRRRGHIDGGRSELRVGHLDLIAHPSGA